MPLPKWPEPSYLHPPKKYTTCWRCPQPISPSATPRTCRDCSPTVKAEKEAGLWATAS